jgi:hypothetical protein
MALNAADSANGATDELYRLRQRGLIQWRPRRMEWTLTPEHAGEMTKLVLGRAFAPPA